MDNDGLDRDGLDEDGVDRDGQDRGSTDHDGLDRDGLDTDGLDRDGLDTDGLDTDGLDRDGLDRDGLDTDGLDRDGLNRQMEADPLGKKIESLARFELGQIVWWVVLRPLERPNRPFEEIEPWMFDEHPKSLYERGVLSNLWSTRKSLPRLHAVDFKLVTELLTQEFRVEPFEIKAMKRSSNTGEVFCRGQYGEVMPESYLFGTRAEANRERRRLQGLVNGWASVSGENSHR